MIRSFRNAGIGVAMTFVLSMFAVLSLGCGTIDANSFLGMEPCDIFNCDGLLFRQLADGHDDMADMDGDDDHMDGDDDHVDDADDHMDDDDDHMDDADGHDDDADDDQMDGFGDDDHMNDLDSHDDEEEEHDDATEGDGRLGLSH